MNKTVAIISKPAKPELKAVVGDLSEWLRARGYALIVDEVTADYASGVTVVARAAMADAAPAIAVVLGGDGTLLSAGRALAPANVPILGVNLGSLGFLTEVPVSGVRQAIEAWERGEHSVESRSMVHCELLRDGASIAAFDALNDAVINKSAIARLVSFDLYVDAHFVSNYKADGVIVSTPTGSTAYSLAAGGPILMTTADAFVITPVCVHSLTGRPLVVRDSSEIEVVLQDVDGDAFLTVDGQVGTPILKGDRVRCSKSAHRVTLVRFKRNFFEVLRTKLKWGER